MRVAIVSDLHANLQAWRSVLLDIRALQADRIVCLGDLVGYGPSPVEVLESAYTNVHHFVLGNHDAVICGKTHPDLFNDRARASIGWTRDRLGAEAVRFLGGLPLTLRADDFRCAHAGFASPASFEYIIDAADALASWNAVPEPLLFVGHTHQPSIHVVGASGTPHRIGPQDFMLEPEKRYLVNVGSVGNPRDGRAMASYCVLDTRERTVRWRTVPFDIDAYRDALRAAGQDETPSYFLQADPRRGVPPLRELLSFSPPQEPPALPDTAAVQDLDLARRQARRWRTTALATAAALAVAGAAVGAVAWRNATRALDLPAAPAAGAPAGAPHPDERILWGPMPAAAGMPCARPGLPGWALKLGNRRRMSATVGHDPEDGAALFEVRSDTAGSAFTLRSLPAPAPPGARMAMHALFRTSDDFEGDVALAAVLVRREAGGGLSTNAHFQVRTPTVRLANGWRRASASFNTLARSEAIQLEIRGAFRGTAQVKAVHLTQKPSTDAQ